MSRSPLAGRVGPAWRRGYAARGGTSSVRSGGFGQRLSSRRLERGVDGGGEARLVRRGLQPRHDLPALVDDDRIRRALEAEAVGHADVGIEGGLIRGPGGAQTASSGP